LNNNGFSGLIGLEETVEPLASSESNLTASLMKVLNCFFKPYQSTETVVVQLEDLQELDNRLDMYFIYSLIYTCGLTGN
jgi:dynein heavy chain